MGLFLETVLSGVAVGMLYGLMSFAMVVLFKATATVNFAQGMMGTAAVFVALTVMVEFGIPLVVAVLIGLLFSTGLGVVTFYSVIRPKPSADKTNVIIRTLALSLVLAALIDRFKGVGQPFQFPQLVGSGSLSILGVHITYSLMQTVAVAAILLGGFSLFFKYSGAGLLTRAVAESRETVRLLGVRSDRLCALAWGLSSFLAAIVSLLSAHHVYVSTFMLEGYLLYAFTAAIAFGLTSLTGSVIGGVSAGIVSNVMATYFGPDSANLVIFVALITVLVIRPQGVFGERSVHRV
ncbi:High-affinity branched-chain amino acid transport system permease protein LivH (plasmid) [Rhodococcus ruber]|uniref:branched-chain amino acid ABC transporter permease n=1 Tax=Rhodococcus ruber TaxID=1830 RepID=UPI00315C5C93